MPTYDEAYQRYTEHYKSQRKADNDEMETVYPVAVATHKEMDKIFAEHQDWDSILKAMNALSGTPGPVRRQG